MRTQPGLRPITPMTRAQMLATYARNDQTPSLEELESGRQLGTINATTTILLSPVNLPQYIGALSLAANGAIAASDTDYWTVDLVRYRTGQITTLATKTTKTTGGVAVVALNPWTFDVNLWTAGRYLLKGDVLGLVFTKTGAPADWVAPVATWRYEPGLLLPSGTVGAADTFTRANSTTTLGNAESGQPWVAALGTWGISSNQAYCPTAVAEAHAYVESGMCNVAIQATQAAATTVWSILFRYVDVNNYWFLNTNGLFKRTGGVNSAQLATLTGGAPSGTIVGVRAVGTQITIIKNGVDLTTITDSAFQYATKHGFRASTDTTARFDNFTVTAA